MKLDFRRAKFRSKQKFSQLASSASLSHRRSGEQQTPRSSDDVSETAGTSTETPGGAVPSESSTSAVSESSGHKHTLLNAAALSQNAQNHSTSALTGSTVIAIAMAAREATTETTEKTRPEGGRLWEFAFMELDEDKRLILQKKFPQSKSWQIVDEVMSKTTEAYEDWKKEGWKIHRDGDKPDINVRDKALKLLNGALGFKEIIASGTSLDPTHYSEYAWTALSSILTLLKNHQDAKAAVFSATEYLADLLGFYATVEKEMLCKNLPSERVLENSIISVYKAILVYTAQVVKTLDAKITEKIFSSIKAITGLPLTKLKEDIASAEERADRWISLLRRQYDTERKHEAENILHGIDKKLDDITLAADLEWLSKTTSSARHNKMKEMCTPGTGRWLLWDKAYMKWRDDGGDILWLHGLVGSGKSVLCSSVIEDLKKICLDRTRRLSYWYYESEEKCSLSVCDMLRSIILQLSRPPLTTAVRNLIQKHKIPTTIPDMEELVNTLNGLIAEMEEGQQAYLVLDGLDEYPQSRDLEERARLLDTINEIFTSSAGKLHIFVASRPNEDIRSKLGQYHSININWHPEAVKADIRKFVDSELESRYLTKKESRVKESIKTRLMTDQNISFQWAALYMGKFTQRPITSGQIAGILSKLPKSKTLDEMYAADLDSALPDSDDKEDWKAPIRIAFMLIAVSFDLQASHLAYILGFSSNEEDEAIELLPNSLVAVEKLRGGRRVRFTNFSAREYLLSETEQRTAASKSWCCFSIAEAHFTIAMKALSLILKIICEEESGWWDNPFVGYATRRLFSHVKEVPVNFHEFAKMQDAVDRLLSRDLWPKYQALCHNIPGTFEDPVLVYQDDLCDQDRTRSRKSGLSKISGSASVGPKDSVQLYYATQFGSEKIISNLVSRLDGTSGVDKSGWFQGNPLLAALVCGRSDIVALLLERGFRLSQREFESVFILRDREDIKSLRSSLQAVLGTPTRILESAQHQEANKIRITTEVLRNVLDSEESHESCRSIMETLLDFWPPELQVTDALSKALIGVERRPRYPGVLDLLLDQVNDISTEDGLVAVVACCYTFENGLIYLRRLFDRFGPSVPVTERVMLKIVRLTNGFAEKALEVLFDRKGSDIPVTERVMMAAVANPSKHSLVLQILFDRKYRDDIPVTEEVMKAAARTWGYGNHAVEILFDWKGSDIPVTEEVMKAAAGNLGDGGKILEVLFERKGSEITVTEEVIKAVAENTRAGFKALSVLLDHMGSGAPISEEFVKTVAENIYWGDTGMAMLFRHKKSHVPVTEQVLKAAAKAGNTKVIDEFMRQGILPGTIEKWRPISLLYSAIYERIEFEAKQIRSWVLEKNVLDTIKKENLTLLHEAVDQQNGDVLQMMLDTRVMPLDQRDERGRYLDLEPSEITTRSTRGEEMRNDDGALIRRMGSLSSTSRCGEPDLNMILGW